MEQVAVFRQGAADVAAGVRPGTEVDGHLEEENSPSLAPGEPARLEVEGRAHPVEPWHVVPPAHLVAEEAGEQEALGAHALDSLAVHLLRLEERFVENLRKVRRHVGVLDVRAGRHGEAREDACHVVALVGGNVGGYPLLPDGVEEEIQRV